MRNRTQLLRIILGLIALVVVALVILRQPGGEPLPTIKQPPPAPQACVKDPAPVAAPVAADGRALVYLHTCGGRLFDSTGKEVRITGINWFGAETGTYAPHGLWSRNWQGILDQISQMGYNAVRLPISNDVLVPGQQPQGINYQQNPDLQGLSAVEVLDAIVKGAGQRGIKVVLDRHRPTSAGQSDLWYTPEVSEDLWIADWVMLAQRYAGDDTVIGADLHNEPKGAASWGTDDPATDWRLAAERAGNAILEANPYLLIVVEGIEQYNGDWYWWGGNLMGAREFPVRLSLPGRLVYSPHDYGPGVYRQGWFDAPDFPRNLPRVWHDHWGYLQDEGIAPVLMGEFGGRSLDETTDEGLWQRTLLDYLQSSGTSYFTWSLNPNSGDTGGLLNDDWLNVVSDKYQVYRSYLAPKLAEPRSGAAQPQATRIDVLYRANERSAKTNSISFGLQLVEHSGEPLDLNTVEVRYWFSHGSRGGQPVAEVDYAAVGNTSVKTEVVETKQGKQDHYLRVTFQGNGNVLQGYQSTGDLLLRIHSSDWSEYDQSNDYSFWPEASGYRSSDRITVYIDGKLVWGREP